MENMERFFGNSVLHDCEIGKTEIDYSEGTVSFQFIDSKQEKREYVIKQFISICFTRNEEWGKGKYVVSSDVSFDNGICVIKIQLNSGDICTVRCKCN